MLRSITDRLQARYAARLLEQAKHEVIDPKPRLTLRLAIGWLLAVFVLVSPYLVMAAGLGLIWSTFPEVFPGVFGLILILAGYVLLPPRNRNTWRTYSRADLPHYFALLDQIAERLGTTAPDGVHFVEDFNAYIAQFGNRFLGPKEWVLGMGLPLWEASTPQERVACLAHELGHKVSDDPMRQGVFWRAEQVLTNWGEMLDPDDQPYEVAALAQMVLGGLIRGYHHLLSSLSFFESQRAEYRADALASRVAGCGASRLLLETLTRGDLADRAILDLYPYRSDQGGRIFAHMGAAVSQADWDTVSRFLSEAAAEKRRVDSSHPPTAMRLEFVGALPPELEADVLDASRIDFTAIDSELSAIKNALGKAMMQELRDEELNR
ncbi:M48 family metallopeptidase [Roseovarius sp. 2305UL8-3]|uniref:M48 family metallopeptidase n=1 Tax=Roseovarius conchicola TaxID=3121636 RepID=UPI0035275D59